MNHQCRMVTMTINCETWWLTMTVVDDVDCIIFLFVCFLFFLVNRNELHIRGSMITLFIVQHETWWVCCMCLCILFSRGIFWWMHRNECVLLANNNRKYTVFSIHYSNDCDVCEYLIIVVCTCYTLHIRNAPIQKQIIYSRYFVSKMYNCTAFECDLIVFICRLCTAIEL